MQFSRKLWPANFAKHLKSHTRLFRLIFTCFTFHYWNAQRVFTYHCGLNICILRYRLYFQRHILDANMYETVLQLNSAQVGAGFVAGVKILRAKNTYQLHLIRIHNPIEARMYVCIYSPTRHPANQPLHSTLLHSTPTQPTMKIDYAGSSQYDDNNVIIPTLFVGIHDERTTEPMPRRWTNFHEQPNYLEDGCSGVDGLTSYLRADKQIRFRHVIVLIKTRIPFEHEHFAQNRTILLLLLLTFCLSPKTFPIFVAGSDGFIHVRTHTHPDDSIPFVIGTEGALGKCVLFSYQPEKGWLNHMPRHDYYLFNG